MKTVFQVTRTAGLVTAQQIAEYLGVEKSDRILIQARTGRTPELEELFVDNDDLAPIVREFGHFYDLNSALDGTHPFTWGTKGLHPSRALLEEALRRALGLLPDEPVRLVVESIQAPPSKTLAAIFRAAPIHLYTDGLMSFGPLRHFVHPHITTRVEMVHYVDLLSGTEPLILRDVPGIEYQKILIDDYVARLTHVSPAAERASWPYPDRVAIVLGQYIADIGLLTLDEDEHLLRRMIEVALECETAAVLVKPHPATDAAMATRVVAEYAAQHDVRLLADRRPVEAILSEAPSPGTVVSCFSTGLFTAAALGWSPIQVGADRMRKVLRRNNSNLFPVLLTQALLPGVRWSGPRTVEPATFALADPVRRAFFVRMLGYCLEPDALYLERQAGLVDEFHATGATTMREVEKFVGRIALERLGFIAPRPPAPPKSLPQRARGLLGRARRALARAARRVRDAR